VRRHLRRLGVQRCVHVGDRESGSAHLRRDRAQQRAAVGVLVLRIGIGKVPSDIAERGRSEQGAHTAWMSTSASECPARPLSNGIATPPMINMRP